MGGCECGEDNEGEREKSGEDNVMTKNGNEGVRKMLCSLRDVRCL